MEFFMIEGNLVEHPNMNDELMKEHKAYTKKAMDAGMILFSGLKKGMDGVVFVMKATILLYLLMTITKTQRRRNGSNKECSTKW